MFISHIVGAIVGAITKPPSRCPLLVKARLISLLFHSCSNYPVNLIEVRIQVRFREYESYMLFKRTSTNFN